MNIKSFGYIINQEILKSCNEFEDFKYLILEVENPYPGYSPSKKTFNNYIYLLPIINQGIYIEEQIIKATQKIKKTKEEHFSAYSGKFSLFNNEKYCIRVETDNKEILPELIREYQLFNFNFFKNTKIINSFLSIIKFCKFFDIEFLSESIYIQKDNKQHQYISINQDIEWTRFYNIIRTLKENNLYKNIDFAQTNIFSKDGFDYFIRICSEPISKKELSLIRNNFLKMIKL